MLVQQAAMVVRRVLAAAIRVVQEPGIGAPVGDRHAQRRQGQLLRHGRRHGPTDHLAGEQVLHDGKVEPCMDGSRVARAK
jgi:hypothetical protein